MFVTTEERDLTQVFDFLVLDLEVLENEQGSAVTDSTSPKTLVRAEVAQAWDKIKFSQYIH